jgi:hypothetical protein
MPARSAAAASALSTRMMHRMVLSVLERMWVAGPPQLLAAGPTLQTIR